MRIRAVRATPVTVPTTRPCAWSHGNSFGFTRTIIELESDSKLCGLGEAPGARPAELILRKFAPALIGQEIFERSTLRATCINQHKDYGSLGDAVPIMAWAGIEMALWDLLGKRLQKPLFSVLGGPVRERAPFVAYAFAVDLAQGYSIDQVPHLMADIARESVAESGASMFEFKIGRHGVDCDIETVHAVREAVGPDIALGVDANMQYTEDEARRFLAAATSAKLANIEEPVATLDSIQRLRRDFGVPVSTHCTDMEVLRHYPEIDSVVADFYTNGGIEGNIAGAAIARSHGKRYWLRACLETGITWAAMCHLGIAVRELDRPAQALMNWIEDDLVSGKPWHVKNGGVRPPDQPGLGVELDRDALERYHREFKKKGEMTHYDYA